MNFKVVIPARYESSRFPGKLLRELNNKPVIAHAVEAAISSDADHVVVATDDVRIKNAIEGLDCEIVMTSPDHVSGTDRISEVVTQKKWGDDEIIVNIQGDEPFVASTLIRSIAMALNDSPDADMSTACFPLREKLQLIDKNLVKVVMDHQSRALYFSRAPIPFSRDPIYQEQNKSKDLQIFFGHVGIYGYRASFLKDYSKLPESPLEKIEKLEQLRALQAGKFIRVVETNAPITQGIDTPEDLIKAQKLLDEL